MENRSTELRCPMKPIILLTLILFLPIAYAVDVENGTQFVTSGNNVTYIAGQNLSYSQIILYNDSIQLGNYNLSVAPTNASVPLNLTVYSFNGSQLTANLTAPQAVTVAFRVGGLTLTTAYQNISLYYRNTKIANLNNNRVQTIAALTGTYPILMLTQVNQKEVTCSSTYSSLNNSLVMMFELLLVGFAIFAFLIIRGTIDLRVVDPMIILTFVIVLVLSALAAGVYFMMQSALC